MARIIKTGQVPWRTKKYEGEQKAYGVYREVNDPEIENPQLNVRLTKIAPGETSTKYHSHTHSEEWFYVTKGRCKVCLNGKWSTLEEGDALHCEVGAQHTFINDSREGCHMIMVSTVQADDKAIKADAPPFA